MEPIRKLLVCAKANPVVPITDEDIDNLFDSATTLSYLAAKGNNLGEALKNLDSTELELEKAEKAIIVVRCAKSYKMAMSEMAELCSYIDLNIPKANVTWGYCISDKDENITILAATTY